MSEIGSLIFDVTLAIKEHMEEFQKTGITYLKKNENLGMDAAKELNGLSQNLMNCQLCKLCSTRTNIVFGTGNPKAELVFVGEAPGRDEDLAGEPFVGRAGQLLTKMIEAMGINRTDVYICNVVKCRPPENRNPEPDEVNACQPFLKQQLSFIKPKVIVGLGRYACQTLLGSETTMSAIRGTWHKYDGIDFMPTFHPAYLLRNPPAKKFVWEDLQAVMTRLGLKS